MPKYDDIVIISSDDEQDRSKTKRSVKSNTKTKTTLRQDGANMTNPILLDDDMDWKSTADPITLPQQNVLIPSTTLFPPGHQNGHDYMKTDMPLEIIDRSTGQSTQIQSAVSQNASSRQVEVLSLSPSPPFTRPTQQQQRRRRQKYPQEHKQKGIHQQLIEKAEPENEHQQQQQSAGPITGTPVTPLESTTLDPFTTNIFGLTSDILDYINKNPQPEVKYDIEEPDWSYIDDIDIIPNPVTVAWEPPTNQGLPAKTIIPKGMDVLELFTRLDFYQQSMNQYVNELHPPNKSIDKNERAGGPFSPATSTQVNTRTSSKRNTGTYSPGENIQSTTIFDSSNKASYSSSDLIEIKIKLIKRLETPYHSTMPRPYIPNVVWHGSNWEDWAQFTPADLIHVPFTKSEDMEMVKAVRKSGDRKSNLAKSVLVGNPQLWEEVAVALPGRKPQDCRFRYIDMDEPTGHLFNKPQLVSKGKAVSRTWNNYYDLLNARSANGRVSLPIYQSSIWTNLKNRATVGDGSGDTACLLLERDPTAIDNFQLIAGSLCDDNHSYNMSGNLRIWRSSTGHTQQLKGHVVDVPTDNGGTQALWRTVHDVKTSNNKKLIFSASRDSNAKVWSMESNKLLSTLAFHNGPVHQIAVMGQEEHIIATGSADGTGVIWIIGDRGRSGQGTICETDMVDGMDSCSVECLDFGHGASDNKLFMGYRADLADKTGWITTFDVTRASPIYDIKDMRGSVGCLEISHSGDKILSGNDGTVSGDQMLHVNDVMTGRSILMAQTGHLDVNCVCFSQCDNYIASGSVANQIAIFDIRKASKPVYAFAHNDISDTDGRFIAPDAGIGIAGMYWMKNNRMLITGGGDCTVKVWDVFGSGGLLKSYKTTDPINCLNVNEDLHVLAAGVSGAQGIIHIWQP